MQVGRSSSWCADVLFEGHRRRAGSTTARNPTTAAVGCPVRPATSRSVRKGRRTVGPRRSYGDPVDMISARTRRRASCKWSASPTAVPPVVMTMSQTTQVVAPRARRHRRELRGRFRPTARTTHHAGESRADGVADSPGRRKTAQVDLVTGDQKVDRRDDPDLKLVVAGAGGQRDRHRVEPSAGLDHHVAAMGLIATRTNILEAESSSSRWIPAKLSIEDVAVLASYDRGRSDPATPPVPIPMASCAPSGPSGVVPLTSRPRICQGPSPDTAHPSMAETSAAGRSISERTSLARTRPYASARSHISLASGLARLVETRRTASHSPRTSAAMA